MGAGGRPIGREVGGRAREHTGMYLYLGRAGGHWAVFLQV